MVAFEVLLKKELPIFVSIIDVYLLTRHNVSIRHQKCFVFWQQLYCSISAESFKNIHYFIFSIFFVLFAEVMFRFELYNVVSSRSWWTADDTIFLVQIYHFVLHQKRFCETVFLWNDCSIILRNVLASIDGFFSKQSETRTLNFRLFDLKLEEFRIFKYIKSFFLCIQHQLLIK